MVRNKKERKMWDEIDFSFMTGESEAEDDDDSLIVNHHPLPWRSHS